MQIDSKITGTVDQSEKNWQTQRESVARDNQTKKQHNLSTLPLQYKYVTYPSMKNKPGAPWGGTFASFRFRDFSSSFLTVCASLFGKGSKCPGVGGGLLEKYGIFKAFGLKERKKRKKRSVIKLNKTSLI